MEEEELVGILVLYSNIGFRRKVDEGMSVGMYEGNNEYGKL